MMLFDPTTINLLTQPAARDCASGLAKKQGKEKKPDANLVSLVFPGR